MQEFTLVVLLDWIYQKFSLIFVICLLGCFIHDILDTMKNCTRINIKQIMTSTFISSIMLTAILDYFNGISFSLYIFICFFTGMWSCKILDYALNWDFVKKLLTNFIKTIKSSAGTALSKTIEEIDREGKNDT